MAADEHSIQLLDDIIKLTAAIRQHEAQTNQHQSIGRPSRPVKPIHGTLAKPLKQLYAIGPRRSIPMSKHPNKTLVIKPAATSSSPSSNKAKLGGASISTKSEQAKSAPAKLVSSTAAKVEIPKANQGSYCVFFNRFGKCKNGDACTFIHDKLKVAVCRNFLKGLCTDSTCPLTHQADANKLPVCYHFLRGNCVREDCPYSHVNVDPNAAVCEAFLQGYCPKGSLCPLRHVHECPDFSRTGSCPRSEKCKWRHISKRSSSTRRKPGSRHTDVEATSTNNVEVEAEPDEIKIYGDDDDQEEEVIIGQEEEEQQAASDDNEEDIHIAVFD